MRLTVQLSLGLLMWQCGQPAALPLADFASGHEWEAFDSSDLTTVRPGLSVGPLKLGDTYERATELFPVKADIDQGFPQAVDCGRELNWVDMKNSQIGNMFIRFKDGVVFQIDVATTRYHTADGIGIGVFTGKSTEALRRTERV